MTVSCLLASTQTSSTLIGIVLVVLAVFVYFLPAITAHERKVPDVGTVFILNLLLGWTLIGWVVALAMAYRTPAPKRAQQLADAFAASQVAQRPSATSTSGAPPPGWHPDPAGRGDKRWWDGMAWTENVVDAEGKPLPPDPIGTVGG